MIDIEGKPVTDREAVASCRVSLSKEVAEALAHGRLPKGDALQTARVAAILAAKRTAELIPLCHPIPVSHIGVDFDVSETRGEVTIAVTVRAQARTGVEMEALTGAAVAALTIYDMTKGLYPEGEIGELRLLRKTGGKSERWERKGR